MFINREDSQGNLFLLIIVISCPIHVISTTDKIAKTKIAEDLNTDGRTTPR
jgi:hypothetical protein